jgi:hypothetical protein
MKIKAPITTLFSFLFFIAGCATSPKYDPFIVPQATVHATVKTIAIYHPHTNNPVEIQFERLIENELKAGNFATIGPDRINLIAEHENQSVGGLFDPQTGAEDKAKSDLYWRNFLQEIKSNYNADAVLAFAVVKRQAKFNGNRAEWDGATEAIYTHYGLGDFLLQTGTDYGTTSGLSLKILLTDLQRQKLYQNYGGIQLTMKLSQPSEVFRKQTFVNVPEAQLFSDTNRIYAAVTNALGPLVYQKTP